MTSPRRTGVEHVLTSDFEPIGPHIQAANVSSPGGTTHDKLHDMSSHTDRHKGASIASAASITPGTDGDYYDLTGVVNVTSITARQPGDRIMFRVVNGGLKFTHLTGTLNMRAKVNFVAQSGDMVQFVCEGLNAAGNPEWSEFGGGRASDSLIQAFEVTLAIEGPVEPIGVTVSTGTGTSGLIIIGLPDLPAVPVPGAPTVDVHEHADQLSHP